jgi:hypothetical protein
VSQRPAQPQEQLGAVGHRQVVRPGPQGAAGRVVRGDDHQLAGRAVQGRRADARSGGLGDRFWSRGADPDEVANHVAGIPVQHHEVVNGHRWPPQGAW